MYFLHKAAVKVLTATIVACIFLIAVSFVLHKENITFTCEKEAQAARGYSKQHSSKFLCYAAYYEKLTEVRGVRTAFEDIKKRKEVDSYAKQECHLITHIIGRKAGSMSSGAAEAFTLGEYFCGGGYFHGVMESVIQMHGKAISAPFLYNLCAPFQEKDRGGFSVEHLDCAHGIGHGLMYVNNNELFESLHECDSLLGIQEQYSCWVGVFMENGLADTQDHSTKYLKTDDLMYPCDAVEEKYKPACYDIQTSYIRRATGSFANTLLECKNAPERFQTRCVIGIGRDIAVDADMDIERSKAGCLALSEQETERESCVKAVVGARIHYFHSRTLGENFCEALPAELKTTCFGAAESYAEAINLP